VAEGDVDGRLKLAGHLRGDCEPRYGGSAAAAHAATYRKAQRMIETEARGAFRLEEESAKLRDAYGRNRFGQGCLLARRLVERGGSFVGGTLHGWDTHVGNFEAGQ